MYKKSYKRKALYIILLQLLRNDMGTFTILFFYLYQQKINTFDRIFYVCYYLGNTKNFKTD